jgi:hypothetical protein
MTVSMKFGFQARNSCPPNLGAVMAAFAAIASTRYHPNPVIDRVGEHQVARAVHRHPIQVGELGGGVYMSLAIRCISPGARCLVSRSVSRTAV